MDWFSTWNMLKRHAFILVTLDIAYHCPPLQGCILRHHWPIAGHMTVEAKFPANGMAISFAPSLILHALRLRVRKTTCASTSKRTKY
eukprot:6461440-Amphidinium_carterae.1